MTVELALFDGVTHSFDQAEKAPLSTLGFTPAAAQAARRATVAFLARHAAP